MSENKTGKYIKYAIGEIILVMIGILLALQVNNWNENRKEAIAIKNVLIEIREDLINDKTELESKIQLRTEDFEAQNKLVELLEKKSEFNENIQSYLGHIILFRPVYSASKGYELLKEMNLGNLNDKELRVMLTRYYERNIPEVHQENTDDRFEFETFWLPYVRKHFIEWEFGNYAIPEDYTQIVNDRILLTTLKINSNNIESTLEAYKGALNTGKSLVELINKRINN